MSLTCSCNGLGQTDCPSGTVAICKKIGSRCYGSCKPIPEIHPIEVVNYLIQSITEDERKSFNKSRSLNDIPVQEDLQLLKSGEYKTHNMMVNFTLPKEVENMIGAMNEQIIRIIADMNRTDALNVLSDKGSAPSSGYIT